MFPTHVGMNRKQKDLSSITYYVPHTRGDEPIERYICLRYEGCSPHTWG